MRAWRVLALALVVLAIGACGTGRADDDRARALKVLRAAQAESYDFDWTEKTDVALNVNGSVEDDFRFGGTLNVDGTPVLSQAVLDDAIAVQVHAVDRLPANTRVGDAPVPAGQPGAGRVPEVALRQGAWVADLIGAPGLSRGKARPSDRGGPIDDRDLVYEADRYLATVIDYVRAAAFVVRYNPESAEYRPREDPFPKPASGEIRYDLVRTPLPRASADGKGAAGGSGGQQNDAGVPTAANFRKLGIYVKNGKITHILERVKLDERLDETVRLMRTLLKTNKVPPVFRARFDVAMKDGGDTRDVAMIQTINLLSPQTSVPVRFLTTEYARTNLAANQTIELPTDLVLGKLDQFFAKPTPQVILGIPNSALGDLPPGGQGPPASIPG